MRTFKSESEVIQTIGDRLLQHGVKNEVSVHSDTQGENTVVRHTVFKVAVAMSGSSVIVDAMADIGTDTDRAISYKGSQAEPSEQGEIRYLFFGAKINPFEE